jgi:hypothetical protein
MQPGELRRFKDGLMGPGDRVSGQPFVIINVHPHLHPHVLDAATDFLVGGQIETGWNLTWVMNNSEALNEAG